jgi:hypothetical protein
VLQQNLNYKVDHILAYSPHLGIEVALSGKSDHVSRNVWILSGADLISAPIVANATVDLCSRIFSVVTCFVCIPCKQPL